MNDVANVKRNFDSVKPSEYHFLYSFGEQLSQTFILKKALLMLGYDLARKEAGTGELAVKFVKFEAHEVEHEHCFFPVGAESLKDVFAANDEPFAGQIHNGFAQFSLAADDVKTTSAFGCVSDGSNSGLALDVLEEVFQAVVHCSANEDVKRNGLVAPSVLKLPVAASPSADGHQHFDVEFGKHVRAFPAQFLVAAEFADVLLGDNGMQFEEALHHAKACDAALDGEMNQRLNDLRGESGVTANDLEGDAEQFGAHEVFAGILCSRHVRLDEVSHGLVRDQSLG